MKPISLITLDDNEDLNYLFLTFFNMEEGIDYVKGFTRASDAKKWDGWERIDVALIDYMMPESSGVEFAEWLKQNHPRVKRVLLTAINPMDEFELESLQVFHFVLTKPIRPSKLIEFIYEVIGPPSNGPHDYG